MLFIYFHSEAVNAPLIPLGLKETKEVDFTVAVQVNILSVCLIYFLRCRVLLLLQTTLMILVIPVQAPVRLICSIPVKFGILSYVYRC